MGSHSSQGRKLRRRQKNFLIAGDTLLSLTAVCAFILTASASGAALPDLCQQQNEASQLAARLSSANEEERFDAAVSLSTLRSKQAAAALRAATDDLSERVRAAAISGLAAMGDKESASMIAAKLREDKSLHVRKQAAYALGELRASETTPSLITALRDKNAEVRGAAAFALGQCEDESAIEPLIAALKDKADFVRAQAARALGLRAASQAVAALTIILSSDKDNEVKRQSALALGLIGDGAALPALREAAQSSDPLLSEAAMEAIRMITSKQ
jgi:HEAT repeat protein